MNKEQLLKRAEAALEKNIEIVTEQNQPQQAELAIKTIPVLVEMMKKLNLV